MQCEMTITSEAASREFVSSIFVSFSYLYFFLYSHTVLLRVKYFYIISSTFLNIIVCYF